MNSAAFRPPHRLTRLALVLVVAAVAAACGANSALEPAGQVVVVPAMPASSDVAATISANLRATLPPAATPPAGSTPTPAAEAVERESGPFSSLPTATPVPEPTPAPTATPTLAVEPTPDGVVRTAKVPILMYHYISTPPADANAYRVDLSTPPELLAAHLDRLLAEGYTTISLYQLLAHLTQGAPLPEKPVVITFDDGYRDNYENAFPLLRDRGLTATFFVVTDFIDEQRPVYLSWNMAREMLAAGMSIESHGRNHFTLEGQDENYLVWQALGSLETLQYELGVRPRFVSYPAGDYDQRTIDIFHSANYWAGLTTTQGTQQSSEHPFELERIRMRNTTTPDSLIRSLQADW
jgi:peptidoglycan/xylan/chitin deacetylase (PgdA/CDA1 family)